MTKKTRDRLEATVVWVGVPTMVFLAVVLLFYSIETASSVQAQELRQEERTAQMAELLDRVDFLVDFVVEVQRMQAQLQEEQADAIDND